MATTVDELIVKIRADTRELERKLDRTKKKVNSSFDKKPVRGFGAALSALKGPLAGLLSGMAAFAAIKSIATISMEFEDLKDSLDVVFGSIKAGDNAMKRVLDFAKTTPFQVETATKAFIALKSAGIEPTNDMLQTFADTASVSVDQLGVFEALVRITQRSASGGLGLEELNQIMDRGIDVLGILKDRLKLGKDEIAEFGKTAAGAKTIMAALTAGLKERFGGAMETKMDNLSTKTSNMTISFKALADEIGKGGLISFLKETADWFEEIASSITLVLFASRTGVSEGLRAALTPETVDGKTGEIDVKKAWEIAQADLERAGALQIRAEIKIGEELAEQDKNPSLPFNDRELREQTRRSKKYVNEIIGTLVVLREAGVDTGDALAAIERGMIEGLGEGNEGLKSKITERFEAAFSDFEGSDFADVEITFSDEGLITFAKKAEEVVKESGNAVADAISGAKVLEDARLLGQLGEARSIIEKDVIDPLLAVRTLLDDLMETPDVFASLDPANIEALKLHLQGIIDDAALDDMNEKFGHLKAAIDGTITPAQKLKQVIADLQAIINSKNIDLIKGLFGDRSDEDIKKIMDAMNAELVVLQEKTEDVAETFSTTMAPAIAQMAHAFTNDFVNSLLEAGSALDAFKNFAKNIVSQIIATFLQMAVVNQILNTIFGGIDGWQAMPTIGGGGGGGSGGGGAGAAASGGAMMRGVPYLVGERGAELFIPHTAGTLKNANDTRSMGGGGNIVVNQNLNFSTGVVPTVRTEIQKMLPQISEMTKASVLEATRRGGAYRRGMLGA